MPPGLSSGTSNRRSPSLKPNRQGGVLMVPGAEEKTKRAVGGRKGTEQIKVLRIGQQVESFLRINLDS